LEHLDVLASERAVATTGRNHRGNNWWDDCAIFDEDTITFPEVGRVTVVHSNIKRCIFSEIADSVSLMLLLLAMAGIHIFGPIFVTDAASSISAYFLDSAVNGFIGSTTRSTIRNCIISAVTIACLIITTTRGWDNRRNYRWNNRGCVICAFSFKFLAFTVVNPFASLTSFAAT
jgi:hypothetical protein